MVPTRPPYNQAVAYHQHNDRLPRGAYLNWIEEVSVATYRVLKEDGSFFLNINGSGTGEDPTLPYAILERAIAAGFVLQIEIEKVRRRKGGTYPLSHLYGHFGLVRLTALGSDVAWVKA